MSRYEDMWQCFHENCGYIYNPLKGEKHGGIPKETPFLDLPEEWRCPVCGSCAKSFRPLVSKEDSK